MIEPLPNSKFLSHDLLRFSSMNDESSLDEPTESSLSIRLLGPPQIRLNDQPIQFASRKALALIAYLACHQESRPRAEVASLLWPESDTKRGRGALRYTLSIIRKEVGEEWFQSDRNTIGIAQHKRCVVDIADFQQLLKSGRDHMHSSDIACLDCLEDLNAAVSLYRDDFLTGFGLADSIHFDEWQFFQVEEFRHQLADTLRVLIRYHTQQADYYQALTCARRLLQLDPLQESVQRKTMQLYAHSGQWEQAIHQYEACVELLERELGVPPSPATIQLYEEVRSRKLGAEALPTQTNVAAAAEDPDRNPDPNPDSTSVIQPTRPHNLPAAAAPILGRSQDIAAIRELLADPHCRMVTLLGPGGIGKTRLAHQIAIDLCNSPEAHFADAIYFVPLAAIETTDLLVTAIATALKLSFSGSKTPKEQLFQYLQQKQFLLILDNFEQLVSSAPLIADLFNVAAGLKFLVTSRERLNLYEEWLYEIQGLPLPPRTASTLDDVAENGAAQLYFRRARRLDPHFNPEEALPAVVEICHLLQGMPLGIELAAGWSRTFSSTEIARQIGEDLDFLATGSQNVPKRHRSLRAAFLHSWRRLEEDEQSAFAKAAIFRGGFTLDAATTIIGATPMILSTLIDKSMVQRVAPGQGQPDRYSIHELLRQFAEEMLAPAQREVVAQDHCGYFAELVDSEVIHCGSAGEDAALARISQDLDNIRGAWHWLVGQIVGAENSPLQKRLADGLGLFVPMLAHYFIRLSRYQEGEQLFRSAAQAMGAAKWNLIHSEVETQSCSFRFAQVEARMAEYALNLSLFQEVFDTYTRLLPQFRHAEDPSELGSALAGLSKTLIRMGRYAEAEPLLLEGLEIFRSNIDLESEGVPYSNNLGLTATLNSLGILYSNQGRFEDARPYYEEFLDISRENQYIHGMANALNNLGSNYARAGQHDRALTMYLESHQFSLKSGDRLMIAAALSNLGSVSRALGHFAEALRYYRESLALCREIGERRWTAAGLNGLGLVLIDEGNSKDAEPHLREALSIAQKIESLPDMLDALSALGDVILKKGSLKRALPILHFVANHSVTQTLSRTRSQELLDRHAQNGDCFEELIKDERDIEVIVALATTSDPSV